METNPLFQWPDACMLRHRLCLLQKMSGFDINTERDIYGRHVLHAFLSRTTGNQRLELVKILCDEGADVNTLNPLHQTPFFVAIMQNDFELATLLRSYGADLTKPDRYGRDVMRMTHDYNNNVAAFEWLLQNGFPLDHPSTLTAVIVLDCAERYVALGGDPCVKTRRGNTLGHFMILEEITAKERYQHLCRLGWDIHAMNAYGQNVLHFVAMHGQPGDYMDFFLEQDVNVYVKDNRGKTPLDYSNDIEAMDRWPDLGDILQQHHDRQASKILRHARRMKDIEDICAVVLVPYIKIPPRVSCCGKRKREEIEHVVSTLDGALFVELQQLVCESN